MDDGEKPNDALRREVKEETGLDIIVHYLLHATSLILENTQQKQAIDICFLYTNKTANQNVLTSPEYSECRWVNKNDVDVASLNSNLSLVHQKFGTIMTLGTRIDRNASNTPSFFAILIERSCVYA